MRVHCTFTIPKLFLMTALGVVATAARVLLISLACFCMNQWYMTTVFLTIVFVGQGVYLMREMEEERFILGWEGGLFDDQQ